MKLSDLLVDVAEVGHDLHIAGLTLDSRQVKEGDAFIALNGALQHGLQHAEQAVAGGSVVIIYDPEGITQWPKNLNNVPAIAVKNLGQRLGEIAARFYDHPSRELLVIGVTGTNGKTTCSQLIAQAVRDCGVIGTLGWGVPGNLKPSANTTPDALAVQRILHQFVAERRSVVAMEVSSHGLQQGRVSAVTFKGAVFTNLTRDHLDYHGSMEEYLRAKLGLFVMPGLQFAVVNLDDGNSGRVLDALAKSVKAWGFSVNGRRVDAVECLMAENVVYETNGIRFDVRWGEETVRAHTPIIGEFNLQNVLTVLCVLLALGWTLEDAVKRLEQLQAVAGRMEIFGGQGAPAVYVDYAHTPDALEKVLKAVPCKGQLWAIFGCGGDRDKGKRPEMGRIAEACADRVVITSDNPRSEDPQAIINDILSGCHSDKISIIDDRQAAILTVIQQAAPDDCVVIAGKGHENYQEIGSHKMPFSDQAVVRQALGARKVQA